MTAQSQLSRNTRGFRWWLGRILIAVFVLIISLIGLILFEGVSAKSKLAAEHPAPGQLVNVGGYKMHLHCIGQGSPTVIMDAGASDFSVTWSAVQSEIGEAVRVCSYDRAGFGWSEPNPNDSRTSETMVSELNTLLSNADIEGPYILVGHSFGGMNMRLYAQRHPEKVVGLVLVDSTYEVQSLEVQKLYQEVYQHVLGEYRVVSVLKSLGLLALSPEDIPDPGLPVDAQAQYRAILASTDHVETMIAELDAIEASFEEVREAKITSLGDLPLVVLSAEHSDLPFLSEAQNQQMSQAWKGMQAELATQSSNSKQIFAKQSGHYIQLEQPQRVIDAIRQIVSMAQS